MALQINLDPKQQHELETLAQSEGASIGEYARHRLLPTAAAAPIRRMPVNDTAQAQRAAVLAYINAPKEEIARLNAPDIAHLEAELAEAANATPEEIAEADAEWEEHKRRMNAHRAVTGERPLFADVVPAGL